MRIQRPSDDHWMQHALDLAVQGVGLTRPNPPVGAVVVKGSRIIGEGFHPRAGEPHAEVFALRQAGAAARGATLYVTLEPCCTQGRTPPCTEAIIAAGIRRVVYGCVDPNPAHAGRADAILRRAGITVTRPVLESSCQALIAPFATRLLHQRPFVTLKLACTLDGRIADPRGRSKWITGPEAREAVQELRRTADAIMVGAETIRADDPSLLPRPAEGRAPWRVVIAGTRPLPAKARIFTDDARSRTLVYVTRHFAQAKRLAARGITVVTLPAARGNVSVKAVLRDLAARGCMHLLCEGGGVLAEALLRENLIDQCWMFYSPRFLGDAATPCVAGRGWQLDRAPGFVMSHVEQRGGDVLMVVKRPPTNQAG